MNNDQREFYDGKNVLITGGLGFIGSSLAIELVRRGARVTVLDGLLPELGGNWFNIEPIKDTVAVTVAAMNDRAATDYCVKDQDIVFNLAMHSSHVDSMKVPLYDLETNVASQLSFLESLRRVNPTARVVYIGSRAQFGPVTTLPITEETLPRPADIYAAGKHVVEWYHLLYGTICGLRATSIRLGNTYGPRHQMKHAKYGVQNYLIRIAMDDGEIQVFGEGKQLREMIYISDVVEALLRLGQTDAAIGQVYCIGATSSLTFLDLVTHILAAAGSGRYRHVAWPEERQRIEVGDVSTDFSKLTGHTGWQPTVSLTDGLRMTVDYYRQHRHYYW